MTIRLPNVAALRQKVVPLYKGNERHCGYLAINCETGGIWVGSEDASFGMATPDEVAMGRTREYRLPLLVKGKVLARVIGSKRFRRLVQRIYDGVIIELDNGVYVGRANDDANEAEEELIAWLEKLEDEQAEVFPVQNWLFAGQNLSGLWYGEPLEDVVAQLEEQASRDEKNIDIVIWGSIRDALLDTALREFNEEDNELDSYHIQALLDEGLISEQEAREWKEAQEASEEEEEEEDVN